MANSNTDLSRNVCAAISGEVQTFSLSFGSAPLLGSRSHFLIINSFILVSANSRIYSDWLKQDLTRLPSQTTSSRWQVDKKAIGLSRVQQFSHLCVASPYQIAVNSIFNHIHTTSINTIIRQFVPFIYHPM